MKGRDKKGLKSQGGEDEERKRNQESNGKVEEKGKLKKRKLGRMWKERRIQRKS